MFDQKQWYKNFANSTLYCVLWSDHYFYGKTNVFFRQINVFTIEVTKELSSRNFLSVIAFFSTFPLHVCPITQKCSHKKTRTFQITTTPYLFVFEILYNQKLESFQSNVSTNSTLNNDHTLATSWTFTIYLMMWNFISK